jgi:hypothetical protein
MKQIVLLILSWLLALPLAAQERPPQPASEPVRILVRSGEHGSFTRLALTFPAPPDWRLGRSGAGYELRLEGGGFVFDLSEAFARITRARIADLAAGTSPAALRLGLACDCHVRPFVADGRILVLDIRDGAAPPNSPFELPLEGRVDGPSPQPPEVPDPAGLAELAPAPAIPRRDAALLPIQPQATTRVDGRTLQAAVGTQGVTFPFPSAILSPRPPGTPGIERFSDSLGPALGLALDPALDRGELSADGDQAMAPGQGPVARVPDAGTLREPAPDQRASEPATLPPEVGLPDLRLAQLRDELVRSMGEAAARGTIEFEGPVSLQQLRTRAAPAADRSDAPLAAGTERPGNSPQMQMAMRRDGVDPTRDRSRGGQACIPDERLEVADWGRPEDLADNIAFHRRQLVGEFDVPRPAAVEALAKVYLGAGFGAEARLVLDSFVTAIPPEALPDAPMLASMGHIMDGESPPRPNVFEGLEVCDGHVALWAALGSLEVPSGTGLDTRAIERGFSALPLHLRSLLGPGLVSRLLAAGHDETVHNLRQSLARASADPSSDPGQKVVLGLVDARLDLREGRAAEAERALQQIATANTPLAVRAMVELVDLRIQQGKGLSAEEYLTLGALARENSGGPDAHILRRAEALATAAAGDFSRPLRQILPPGDPVRAEIWALLSQRGPDAALVQEAVDGASRWRNEAAPSIRKDMAARLLDLGFAEAALTWLGDLGTDQARLLRARAELHRSAPAEAIARIEGLQGPEAALIRAQALLALGQDGAASEMFEAAGMAGESQQAALRAGDLARVVVGPDARLAALAEPLVEAAAARAGTAGAMQLPAPVAEGPEAGNLSPATPGATGEPPMAPVFSAGDSTATPLPAAPLAAGRALLAAAQRDRDMLRGLISGGSQ